jgi:hypothetical protein
MAKNGKIEGNANLKKEAPGRDNFQPSQSSRAVKMSTPTMISRPKRRAIPSPDPYVFMVIYPDQHSWKNEKAAV